MNEIPIPPPEQVIPPAVSTQPVIHKKPTVVFIIGGIVIFIIIVVSFIALQSNKQTTPESVAGPTPYEIITPTPRRTLSRVASTSEFMQFHTEVASLSGALQSFNFQDATLVPPVFDTTIEIAL